MKRISAFLLFCLLLTRGFAAWYWPFGSNDAKKPPRMSELMEEASIMIDDAADLANQGEITEAVEKYKEAFAELERIELENPVRAATSEFSTVRNKKAYISAAIDSLLLNQASDNVRAVSVTDTSEIEKKYAEEQKQKIESAKSANEELDDTQAVSKKNALKKPGKAQKKSPGAVSKKEAFKKALAKDPKNRKVKAMLAAEDLKNKDYVAAELTIKDLLAEKPNDATALNLKAALEAAKGDYKAARETLHQLITSNPKEYSGYYNLARLIIRMEGDAGKPTAARYYETGYKYYGGPKDENIEEMLR
jgi:tetratricopeptide (TPR) repeat protein